MLLSHKLTDLYSKLSTLHYAQGISDKVALWLETLCDQATLQSLHMLPMKGCKV